MNLLGFVKSAATKMNCNILPIQVEKKPHTELSSLNCCAVPFLRRAGANSSWYFSTLELRLSFIKPHLKLYFHATAIVLVVDEAHGL